MSPFADDTIVYIDNPKELMKNLELMIMNRFSEVANYKITTQIPIPFPTCGN